jgi:hypothetical protein
LNIGPVNVNGIDTYNFIVDDTGNVTIRQGDVNITSGSINLGAIKDKAGNVIDYNFKVTNGGNVTIRKGGIYLGGTEKGAEGETITYKFEVDTNGKITAQNAVIQGEITANTGKIGSWTINKDGVLSADVGSDTSYFFKIGKGNKWESWIRGDGAAKFGVGTLSDYGLFIDSETGNNDIFLYANDGIKIGTTTTSVFYAD